MSGCSVHDLYKYGAYPSQTLIGPPPDLTFGPPVGFCLNFNMASDNATGQLFMAEWNSRTLYTVNANDVVGTAMGYIVRPRQPNPGLLRRRRQHKQLLRESALSVSDLARERRRGV